MLVQYAKRLIRDVAAGLALIVLFTSFPERASSRPATTQLKAVDPQVQAFASRSLDDYSRSQQALSSVAAADQAQVPERLSGEALRDYRRLIVIPRPWFDRLYVYMMYKWHAVALRGYQEAAKTVTEPKLRAWTE